MSKSLIAQRTPDALLLRGKVNRVLTQVSNGCATQGALVSRSGDVERSLGFERLAAEGAQPVTGSYSVGPQLGSARGEHPKSLLGHVATVGARKRLVFTRGEATGPVVNGARCEPAQVARHPLSGPGVRASAPAILTGSRRGVSFELARVYGPMDR